MARWDQMTRAEKVAFIDEKVARSRAEQGLPRYVDDPSTLARIARLVAPHLAAAPGSEGPGVVPGANTEQAAS